MKSGDNRRWILGLNVDLLHLPGHAVSTLRGVDCRSTPLNGSRHPTMQAIRYEEVNVCGSTIAAVVANDDKAYFSPRWVCQQLGIDWNGQRVKILNDPVFNSVVEEISTTARDGKNYKMTFMPIEHLAGWLTTIKKVPDPVTQDLLTAFRREAFSVLDAWFRKGMGKNESLREEFGVPKTFLEALQLAADLEAKRIKLEQQNAILAPKAQVYDAHYGQEGVLTALTKFVRTLEGVNTMRVKQDLAKYGYLYKVGRSNYREQRKSDDWIATPQTVQEMGISALHPSGNSRTWTSLQHTT